MMYAGLITFLFISVLIKAQVIKKINVLPCCDEWGLFDII